MKPFFSLSVLLLSAVLMLTACAGSGEIRAIPLTPLPSATPLPTSTPLPTATPVPMPTEAATLPAERVDSCLVGRWIVSDASPYFQTAFQGTDIVLGGTSGNAWYNFGEAGIFLLEAIQFAQSAAVKTDVGEVPVDVVMDGIALARYRVEGDKVFFREQSVTSLVFQVEAFGETLDLDPAGLLGDAAAGETAFLFECVGADRLLLTPPLDNYGVFPLVLERYP